jgi:hypothetical protein
MTAYDSVLRTTASIVSPQCYTVSTSKVIYLIMIGCCLALDFIRMHVLHRPIERLKAVGLRDFVNVRVPLGANLYFGAPRHKTGCKLEQELTQLTWLSLVTDSVSGCHV